MAKATSALRWTTEIAAGEFGIDRKTLIKRIRTVGIEPGKDHKFSTKQICAAVYGDIDGERLSKTRAERELLEMELAKERKEVIPRGRLFGFLENIFIGVKMKIIGSGLSQIEQDQILNDLVGLRDAEL